MLLILLAITVMIVIFLGVTIMMTRTRIRILKRLGDAFGENVVKISSSILDFLEIPLIMTVSLNLLLFVISVAGIFYIVIKAQYGIF